MSDVLDNPDKYTQDDESSGGEPAKTVEEIQEDIIEALNSVYERLDDLDADTAEMRARSILQGLGFTHNMQSKVTKDFSGGWRMRVSLARALFIQPVWYVIYKTVLLLACLLYSCIISHLSHFLSLFHTHTHTPTPTHPRMYVTVYY